MSLSQVGLPGQRVDVLNGGDVDPDGRLLSVAEIQQAFRELRARKAVPGASAGPAEDPPAAPVAPAAPGDRRVPARETASLPPAAVTSAGSGSGTRIESDWVAVVAAHAGAGASTTALAVTDVLAAAGPVRLIETAHPTRSGLAATAANEMGLDASGSWRRGVRGTATILRRAGADAPLGWPELDLPGQPTVVDFGLPAPANLARLAEDGPRLVVVCRPSIPGARLAEQVLALLPATRVVVLAVGPRKWPSEVVASLGPRLRELRAAGRVVCVEEDRRLQVTGPTHTDLPRHLIAAASDALRLLDPAREGAASPSAHGAPRSRTKGTPR
jgi:hypothetical protein